MARFVVRYGVMRMVGVFSARAEILRRGTQVIARTTRGLEAGEVLCEATEQALAQLVDPPSGQVLREMTDEDINEATHLKTREREEFQICQNHVANLKLNMQLVDVEHLFGGERIVVYYLSEERVDFRELVKVLANEFQTRIEMRQIGVRDEAKLLADYGDCGKPVCCNTHLVEMPPVSMKMAKLQKATLDPTKISGRCGRLKCCLRYEYDTYEDLLKTLPPIGADVVTTTGRARILNHEILSQQLLVHTEDNRRMLIPATDVLSVLNTAATRSRGERDERARDDRELKEPASGEPESGEQNRGERNRGERDRGERDRGDKRDSRDSRGGERAGGGRPGGGQGGGNDRSRSDQSSRQARGPRPANGEGDRRDRGGRREPGPKNVPPGQPLDFPPEGASNAAPNEQSSAEANTVVGATVDAAPAIKSDEPQTREPKQEQRTASEATGTEPTGRSPSAEDTLAKDAPLTGQAVAGQAVASKNVVSETMADERTSNENRETKVKPVDGLADATDAADRGDSVT